MFRATDSPILWSISTTVPVGSSVGALYPKIVYTVKKCSIGLANLSSETCRAELKRLKIEKFVAFCWFFTSVFAV